MKGNGFTRAFKKVTSTLLIAFLVMQFVLPVISRVKAATRPESVRVVTDEAEKEALLGTTSAAARAQNILGLASEFSLFVENDATLTGADAEGRIAAGGKITATTRYKYHAGTEVLNDNLAKIIAGNGIENLELGFTRHYITSGTYNYDQNVYVRNGSYDYDKEKIAAIGTGATGMNWESYTDQYKNIVSTDLINFEDEFEFLRNKSSELASQQPNGQISIEKAIYTDIPEGPYMNGACDVVVLSGNSDTNIFTMTADEYASQYIRKPFILDVPEDSKTIINITGNLPINPYDSLILGSMTYSRLDKTDAGNVKLGGVTAYKHPYLYVYDGNDFIRDEDGCIRTFKLEYDQESDYAKYSKVQNNILINLPDAQNLEIERYNKAGSILAPNADVTTEYTGGYLYGSLIAKSFNGDMQFGTKPEYYVPITKIFTGATPTTGAELKVTDENGNELYRWTATNSDKKIIALKEGTYTVEEVQVPGNYITPTNNSFQFTIKRTYTSPYYEISNKSLDTNNVTYSQSLGSGNWAKNRINTYSNLLNAVNTSTFNGAHPYRMDFRIRTNITDPLYYVVASNGAGINAKPITDQNGTYLGALEGTDWIEFKKWTNVDEGIYTYIPPQCERIYDNYIKENYDSFEYPNFNIHFFTADGTEVTDQVEITDITVTGMKKNEVTYEIPDNVQIDSTNGAIYITNEIKPGISIKKTDRETGEPIQNVDFNIVDENGRSVYGGSTNSNGEAFINESSLSHLSDGTYYVKEYSAPSGYFKSTELKPIEFKKNNGNLIEVSFENSKLKIDKYDEFENRLAGAGIWLEKENKMIYGSVTSNNQGSSVINGAQNTLDDRIYIIHEYIAPSGYERAEDVVLNISDDGRMFINGEEKTSVVLKDKVLKGSISITKTGEVLSSTEQLNENRGVVFNWADSVIPGVTYELYAKEDIVLNGTKFYSKDEKIYTQDTGSDGIATFNNLPMGNYYIIEKSAPEGYIVDSTPIEVSLIPTKVENRDADTGYVSYDQVLVANLDAENERKTETVQVTKTEPDGTTPVKDAQYGLYNQEAIGNITANTLLDTATTNDDGQATFTVDLPVGNYYVKEIEAPKGYLLSEESKYINFKESQNFSLNFTDDYTKVKIAKTDKNGNAISGAELKLVEKRTGTTVETWTSDSSPKTIERKLEPGKTYTLQETKAPAGYTTAENKDFVVLETGDIQEIQFVNNPTVVSITKTSLDNQILQGARLKLVEMSTDDVTGEPVETQIGEAWETTNTKKLFEGVLETGKTYKIVELTPPTGYATAQPVTFTVADTDAEQAQEIRDGKTKVKILKQDESGNNITGARLQLLNSSGTALEEWTSTVDGYEIEGELTVGATYKVRELQAPAGYVQAVQDVEFTVSDTTNLQTVVFSNKATVVEINKLDESGNKLAGATLQLFDENNNVVDVWVSTTSGHRVENKLIYGKTYTLKEVKAPAGYATADDVTFTVGSTSAVKQEVNMSDSKLKVAVAKQNEQNELIAGAELKITDSQGTTVETFTSGTTAHEVEAKLEIGKTYFLCETKPAPGYLSTQDVPFTVADSKQTQTITMTDKKTKLSFVKYDENEELVPGAKFELVDNNGNVVESWTTGNTAHDVEGKLEVGKSYTLRETETPEGYAKATDYRFTVDDVKVSTTQNVTIIEKGICVEVSKLDEQGNQISGAELKVLDSEGEEVASWTTDGSAHRLMNTLSAGNTYTLRETKPAPGYVTAEDVSMQIQDIEQVQAFRMTDKKTKVAISKVDASGNPVSGATLQLWDGNQIIDEWVSESTAKQFVGKLVVGKTYTLKETNAPDGYAQAAEKTFTVRDTEEVQSVTMKNTKTKISVSKKDKETEEELAGAELKVTKVDGTEVESWTSAATPHVLEGKLVAGETYILEETKPAEGYVTAEKVIFKVRDTEEIQNVVMKDEKTVFSIEKVKPTGDKLAGAELTITDDEGTEVAKWTTTEDAHEIKGMLAVGKTYTIRETVTPDGYVTAEPKTFTVEDTKEKQEITITNKTTRAEFRKTDKETGKALENAELKLVEVVTDDVTGEETEEVVETWTTGALPYVMDGKLVVGHTYKLIEMEAPEDYKVADPVSFTVENTPEIQIVEMQDEYDHKEITVKVSKQDIVTCEPIEGAELSLQTVEGEEIESWTTTSSAHRIEANLEIGEAYKVVEKSIPQGYVKAQDVLFRVQKTEEVQEVIIKEDYTKVKVEKVDEEGKYVSGAELQIVDQNGNVIEQWITEKEAHELDKVLKAGETYKLRESTVPTGYEKMDDVSFTVSENGQVDTITAVNRKLTVAEITKGIISNVAPKTGDYMIIYLGVFMIAICGLAVIVIRKKHEKKDASKK